MIVLLISGVMALVITDVTMRRGIVPHAIGLILPLGLISGMIRAEARASRVSCETVLVVRWVRVVARVSRAAVDL